jgi:hypothetical protein
MSTIFVTNHSDKILKDGFAGNFYVFKMEETVEIPLEAAEHIFGYGIENKEPYLARLGWTKTTNDLEDGLDRLSKWELSTQPPRKNQSLSPLVDKVPFPSEKKVGGKILTVAA